MPVTWNAEANAKLFLGVLEQLKDHRVKLDHKKLAEYMGSDCTARAVDNQIVKLKKQAEQGPGETDTSAPVTPNVTPRKRGPGRPSATTTPSKKMQKVQKVKEEEKLVSDSEGEEEKAIKRQIKGELSDQEYL